MFIKMQWFCHQIDDAVFHCTIYMPYTEISIEFDPLDRQEFSKVLPSDCVSILGIPWSDTAHRKINITLFEGSVNKNKHLNWISLAPFF